MLNMPLHERDDDDNERRANSDASSNRTESDTQQQQQQQQRRLRRRPRDGERASSGWADVRTLAEDGSGVTKYHVDISTTAQLNWTEWQLMCNEESNQSQDPTWCMIPTDDGSEEEGKGDEEHADNNPRMESMDIEHLPTHVQAQAQQPRGQDQPSRNRRPASESSIASEGTRYVRRRPRSAHDIDVHSQAPSDRA